MKTSRMIETNSKHELPGKMHGLEIFGVALKKNTDQ